MNVESNTESKDNVQPDLNIGSSSQTNTPNPDQSFTNTPNPDQSFTNTASIKPEDDDFDLTDTLDILASLASDIDIALLPIGPMSSGPSMIDPVSDSASRQNLPANPDPVCHSASSQNPSVNPSVPSQNLSVSSSVSSQNLSVSSSVSSQNLSVTTSTCSLDPPNSARGASIFDATVSQPVSSSATILDATVSLSTSPFNPPVTGSAGACILDPLSPSASSVDPTVISSTSSVDPTVSSCASVDPTVISSTSSVDPTVISSTFSVDPTVSSCASVDPTVISSTSSVDPTVSSCASVDPTVSYCASVDPTVSSCASVDPTVISSTSSVDPTVISSTSSVDPTVSSSTSRVDSIDNPRPSGLDTNNPCSTFSSLQTTDSNPSDSANFPGCNPTGPNLLCTSPTGPMTSPPDPPDPNVKCPEPICTTPTGSNTKPDSSDPKPCVSNPSAPNPPSPIDSKTSSPNPTDTNMENNEDSKELVSIEKESETENLTVVKQVDNTIVLDKNKSRMTDEQSHSTIKPDMSVDSPPIEAENERPDMTSATIVEMKEDEDMFHGHLSSKKTKVEGNKNMEDFTEGKISESEQLDSTGVALEEGLTEGKSGESEQMDLTESALEESFTEGKSDESEKMDTTLAALEEEDDRDSKNDLLCESIKDLHDKSEENENITDTETKETNDALENENEKLTAGQDDPSSKKNNVAENNESLVKSTQNMENVKTCSSSTELDSDCDKLIMDYKSQSSDTASNCEEMDSDSPNAPLTNKIPPNMVEPDVDEEEDECELILECSTEAHEPIPKEKEPLKPMKEDNLNFKIVPSVSKDCLTEAHELILKEPLETTKGDNLKLKKIPTCTVSKDLNIKKQEVTKAFSEVSRKNTSEGKPGSGFPSELSTKNTLESKQGTSLNYPGLEKNSKDTATPAQSIVVISPPIKLDQKINAHKALTAAVKSLSKTESRKDVPMDTGAPLDFGLINLTGVQITPEEFEKIESENDASFHSQNGSCSSSISDTDAIPPASARIPQTSVNTAPLMSHILNGMSVRTLSTTVSKPDSTVNKMASMVTNFKLEPVDEGYSSTMAYEKVNFVGPNKRIQFKAGKWTPTSATSTSSPSTSSSQKMPIPPSRSSASFQKKVTPRLISPKTANFESLKGVQKNVVQIAPSKAPVVTKINYDSFDISRVTDILQRKHKMGNYKAPPIPEHFHPFTKSYKPSSCLECGDSFTTDDTLDMHMSRISININYACPLCMCDVNFYNKCQFLGHIRQHNREKANSRNPAIQVKADILKINMAPKNKMFELFEKNFAPIVTVSEPLYSCICTECSKDCEDRKTLSEHFGSSEVMCSFKYVCNTCNMRFPKACAFEAHKRYHSMLTPHTCPECGMVIKDFEEFRDHLNNICFHFSRTYLLRCQSNIDKTCSYTNIRLNSFLKHLEFKHMYPKKVYTVQEQKLSLVWYCRICSMNSPVMVVVQEHMATHLKEAKRNATFAYICIKCPEIMHMLFPTKLKLKEHDKQTHFQSNTKQTEFFCCACNTSTNSYSKCLAHQLQAHEMINAEFYFCQDCKCMLENPDILKTHKLVCQANIKLPFKSKVTNPAVKASMESYRKLLPNNVNKIIVSHEKVEPEMLSQNDQTPKKQGRPLKMTDSRRNFKIAPKTNVTNVAAVHTKPQEEKYKCDFCSKEFSTNAEKAKHKQSEHSSFSCHLCGLTYNTKSALGDHGKNVHEGTKPGFFCLPCKSKGVIRTFTKADGLEKHLVFKHRICKVRLKRFVAIGKEGNKANENLKRKNLLEANTSPVKRLRTEDSGIYTCVKCNFSTEDSTEFSRHIESHKTADAMQCPECGICFSVLPSLKKHLFMVHKIRNSQQYITDKGIKEPEEVAMDDDEGSEEIEVSVSPRKTPFTTAAPVESVRKEGPIGELECRVCYREFENVTLLKTHMRVHGMAFIRSRRPTPGEVKIEKEDDAN